MAIIGRLYVVTLSLLSFFCPLLFFELGVRRNLRFTAGSGVSARLLLRRLFCYTLLLYIRSMSVHALEPLLLIFVGFLFIEMCGTPPRLAMRLRLLLERYAFSTQSSKAIDEAKKVFDLRTIRLEGWSYLDGECEQAHAADLKERIK